MANGAQRQQRPHGPAGQHRLPGRRRALPRDERYAARPRPEHGPAGAGAPEDGRGDAAVRAGRRDRRRRGRLGVSRATACAPSAASPTTSRDHPHRGPHAAAGRGRRRDRASRDGVQRACSPRSRRRATGSAGWWPTPGTSCVRRSPRCAPTSTCCCSPTPPAGSTPAARAELLDDVGAQIEEMSNLVGDLVELARDEPLRTVVEQVDLAEVVDRAVARARRRGTGLTFEVDSEPWWVTGESASLERAVTNLLDNAVKWSPPGRDGADPAQPRDSDRRRRGPGHRRGRPRARLRALLPLRRVALDARLRPRASPSCAR